MLADATEKEKIRNYPNFVVKMYNGSLSLFKLIFGRRATQCLIGLDDCIANLIPSYTGMIFILLKDADCYSQKQKSKVSARQIIDFEVPLHRMS